MYSPKINLNTPSYRKVRAALSLRKKQIESAKKRRAALKSALKAALRNPSRKFKPRTPKKKHFRKLF